MPKTPKRPRDLNQLAAYVGALATHEVVEDETRPTPRQERAAKGGVARAKKLTKKKRVDIARKGGLAARRPQD